MGAVYTVSKTAAGFVQRDLNISRLNVISGNFVLHVCSSNIRSLAFVVRLLNTDFCSRSINIFSKEVHDRSLTLTLQFCAF